MTVEASRELSSVPAPLLDFPSKSSDSSAVNSDSDKPALQGESNGPAYLVSRAPEKKAVNAKESTPPEKNSDEDEKFTSATNSVTNTSANSSSERLTTADWTCSKCPGSAFPTALELQYHLL